MRPTAIALTFSALLAVSAGTATANTITLKNAASIQKGSYTGSIDYNASLKRLTISLTNTTAPSVGGYLTGFVFNIAGNSGATFAGAKIDGSATTNFHAFTSINAAPYGTFEYGLSIGSNANSNFADGGNPSKGIAPGHTGVFTFNITGTNAGSLSAYSFFYDNPLTSEEARFAARFRGFADGSSSKLLADLLQTSARDGGSAPGMVPVPASFAAALPLLGLLAIRQTCRSQMFGP